MKFFSRGEKKAEETAKKVAGVVSEAASEIVSDIKTAAGELREDAKEAFGEAAEDLKECAGDVLEEAAVRLHDRTEKLKDKTTELREEVVDAVQEAGRQVDRVAAEASEVLSEIKAKTLEGVAAASSHIETAAAEARERAAEKAREERLSQGLEKTKAGLFSKLARAIAGRSKVDDDMLDHLEEVLITSDVGVETTVKIIGRIEQRVSRDKYMGQNELQQILREEITALLRDREDSHKGFELNPPDGMPYVVMVVGVNGVGKTTTIGKLAARLVRSGRKVYIGAADTFRAAAIDQLGVWANRAGATMIRQNMGSDPASVAFDTLRSAVANDADVVLIDTAGRLHNKVGLMHELTKIRNVMAKVVPDAPHEVMLVLDASTGQNAFEQAKQFTEATSVSSLAITKLDGTAKGGVVIGISDQFEVPVHYIGVGEGVDDLQVFDREKFVETLFS